MLNITQRIENGKLILEIDLSQDHGPSSTGRSNIVASTKGWGQPEPGISFNLTVVRKPVRNGRSVSARLAAYD
jgi:hypothetical protein